MTKYWQGRDADDFPDSDRCGQLGRTGRNRKLCHHLAAIVNEEESLLGIHIHDAIGKGGIRLGETRLQIFNLERHDVWHLDGVSRLEFIEIHWAIYFAQ